MQQRIKELATEAGMVKYPTGIDIKENTIWGDRNIQKLVELVVAECAYRARQCYTVRAVDAEEVAQHIEGTFK
jgi:hypothetical protein